MKAKKRLDIMFDIETMSTDRDKGLVFSCAWVPFDITGAPLPSEVHPNIIYIDMNDSMMHGRMMNNVTVSWWRRQECYHEMLAIYNRLRVDYEVGWKFMHRELEHLAASYKLHVWSRGIDFDFPMIESSMRDAGIRPPALGIL